MKQHSVNAFVETLPSINVTSSISTKRSENRHQQGRPRSAKRLVPWIIFSCKMAFACCIFNGLAVDLKACAAFPLEQVAEKPKEVKQTTPQNLSVPWKAENREEWIASPLAPFQLQITTTIPWLTVPKFNVVPSYQPSPKQENAELSSNGPINHAYHVEASDEDALSMNGITLAESIMEQDPNGSQRDPFDDRALQLFQAASEGDFREGETGDFILDDILHVMRKSGSISTKLKSSDGFSELESPLSNSSPTIAKDGDDIPRMTQRIKAAEQLLKAARLLEKSSSVSDASLVREMRSTAQRLLTTQESTR